MIPNRVNAVLTAEEQQAILAAVQTIRDRMPFLLDLSPKERRALSKMGDKSVAFVRKALGVALQSPDALPRTFALDDYRRDVELIEALRPVVVALQQLYELVDDTYLQAGVEAYAASRLVYRYSKDRGAGAALDDLVADMRGRYTRSRRAGKTAADPAPLPDPPAP